MYSEFEVKWQINKIVNGDDTPITKARRLLRLSQSIEKFSRRIGYGVAILRDDEDEGAERLIQTVDCLDRLQREARLAAFTALKGGPKDQLAFAVIPEGSAVPAAWAKTKERLVEQNV